MKRLCLLAIAALGALSLPAQTNVTGSLPTPRGPTLISSISADFDLSGREASGREAIYRGRVRVDDPQMKLACEKLVADVPQAGGHVNHIVAETNVVIDFLDNRGKTNHATADKAVYVYAEQGGATNETVTLTGNPQMENEQGTLTGDVIVWDRLNNRLSASNQKMILRQNFSGLAAATNTPEPNITNLPPATVQNTNSNPQ
jgi:lipopolysaccharide export system protein LptA